MLVCETNRYRSDHVRVNIESVGDISIAETNPKTGAGVVVRTVRHNEASKMRYECIDYACDGIARMQHKGRLAFVYQYQTQVIPRRVLFVDFAERRC